MPSVIAPPTAWYCTASASRPLGACQADFDRCERFRSHMQRSLPDLSRCESQQTAWCFGAEPHCAPSVDVCEALRVAASATDECEAVEAPASPPPVERCRRWRPYLELTMGVGKTVGDVSSTQNRVRDGLGAVHDDCPPDRTSGSQLRLGMFAEVGTSSLGDGVAANSALGAEAEVDWLLGETGLHAGPRLAAGARLGTHAAGAVISVGPRLRTEPLTFGVDVVYRSGPGPEAIILTDLIISPRSDGGAIELAFGEAVCTLVALALGSIGPRS